MSNLKPIILAGGPYIVKVNKNGGIDYEYGFVELVIDKNNVKALCENDGCIRSILNFDTNLIIPRQYTYLEKIEIYLRTGFNSIYAYNYADINKFKNGCVKYFEKMSLEIDN